MSVSLVRVSLAHLELRHHDTAMGSVVMSRKDTISNDNYLLRPGGLSITSEKSYTEECQRLQD
jgi:hypothetical protein